MKKIISTIIFLSASVAMACPGGSNGAKCSSKPQPISQAAKTCQWKAQEVYALLQQADDTLPNDAQLKVQGEEVVETAPDWLVDRVTFKLKSEYKSTIIKVDLNQIGDCRLAGVEVQLKSEMSH